MTAQATTTPPAVPPPTPEGRADVTLILEGTYPYVAGGVSSWVHQILGAYPDRRFALLHIGPHPDAYEKPLYDMPASVVALQEVHCRGEAVRRRSATFADRPAERATPSRVLRAIRRLHLDDEVDDELIADLASEDLTIHELLHGGATFELLRRELYEKVSPDAPFMDFFWHFRAMHVPLLRMLAVRPARAAVYHAVSCGYAGLIGAVASLRDGVPLIVTEHGLYARERELELSRASWIQDVEGGAIGDSRPSPLRAFWSHYFRMLSRIAYHQAARLVTLSEANRQKQLADGADPAKIMVVPNGVRETAPAAPAAAAREPNQRMRVGFVGRVVPIKDVVTLIRAVELARYQVDLEVWMIGPEDEDPAYARRCRKLVELLRLGDHVKFLGPQKVSEIYPQLDVVLLTSISEGQPLVMLEAYAHGVPVVATDVGACRELIEGGDAADRALGKSGIITRVANPAETAAALARLAKHPELRSQMGRIGRDRVTARYQLRQVLASYDTLYDVGSYAAGAAGTLPPPIAATVDEAGGEPYAELLYLANPPALPDEEDDDQPYVEMRYVASRAWTIEDEVDKEDDRDDAIDDARQAPGAMGDGAIATAAAEATGRIALASDAAPDAIAAADRLAAIAPGMRALRALVREAQAAEAWVAERRAAVAAEAAATQRSRNGSARAYPGAPAALAALAAAAAAEAGRAPRHARGTIDPEEAAWADEPYLELSYRGGALEVLDDPSTGAGADDEPYAELHYSAGDVS